MSKRGTLLTLSLVVVWFLMLSRPADAQSSLEERPFGPVPEERSPVEVGERVVYPDLKCGPAPCVLPNMNVSGTPTAANETPIVVSPKSAMLMLAGANDYGCESGNGFYASMNGGKSWNRTCIGELSGASGLADPIVAYDLKGHAFIGDIDQGTGVATIALEESSDGGKTWGAPFASVEYILAPGGIPDKPWLEADTNPKSPFANALYISTAQFDVNNNSEITVSNSHDGGTTWQTVAVAPEQSASADTDQFSDVAVAADGTVYATWQRCPVVNNFCAGQEATFYMVKSTDGGNTWTAPAPMFTATLAPDGCHCAYYGSLPNTQEHVSDIPVMGVDNGTGPRKGYLYVVYYTWTGTYMQVRVAVSSDGGNTWTTNPVASSSDQHDQFFPWLSVSKKGVVGVSWLDRRNDPKNIEYEAFAAFSTDGGNTFGTNYQLSAKPSNPADDGFDGEFMGDYTGNFWAGANTLYVTYTDTTTGNGQVFLGGVLLK